MRSIQGLQLWLFGSFSELRTLGLLVIVGTIFGASSALSLTCSQVFFSQSLEQSGRSPIFVLAELYTNSYGKRLTDSEVGESMILTHYSIRDLEVRVQQNLVTASDKEALFDSIQVLTRVLSQEVLNSYPATSQYRQRLINLISDIEVKVGPSDSPRITLFKEQFAAKYESENRTKKLWHKMKAMFAGGRFSAKELHTRNPEISEAQFQYLLNRQARLFDEFSEAPIVKAISAQEAAFVKINNTKIQSLLSIEAQMLKDSNLDTGPREVMRILVRGRNGDAFVSNTITGTSDSMDGVTADFVKRILKPYLVDASVSEIIITHTHPVVNIQISDRSLYMTPLSKNDLELAAEISQLSSGKVLSIRAVVPNGFAYETQFYNGQVVLQ